MPEQKTPRQHLESRVQKRFEEMGMPESAAHRMSVKAVRHFYNQQPDHHRDIVCAEAFGMVQLTLVPAVAQFRALAANVLATVRQTWAAIEPFVEVLDKAQAATPRVDSFNLSEVDVAIDTGNGWETLRGVQSVEVGQPFVNGEPTPTLAHPADDVISGYPHHYVLNGDHSECQCDGHSPECEVWAFPAWKHEPTICNITRTLCIHRPKHTYGQRCAEYNENLVDLVQIKKDRAEGKRGCIAHGGPDCVCEVTSAEPE